MDDINLVPEHDPKQAPAAAKSAGSRSLLLAVLLAVFCLLFWDSLLWAGGLGLGEGAALLGILIAGWFYLRRKAVRRSVYALLCALILAVSAVSLAVSGDSKLKVLLLPPFAILLPVILLERLGLRSGSGLLARVVDWLFMTFGVGVSRIPVSCRFLFTDGTTGKPRRFGAVLVGLLLAVPALAVVLPLLISSDAAFDSLISKLDWSFLGRLFFVLLFTVPSALLLFTVFFVADDRRYRQGLPTISGIAPVTVITFLGVISAAYVLYLTSQLAYFFDGFLGLLPRDFSVAQYARRGFFETSGIVALNLVFLVLASKLCRKQDGRLPGAVKGLGLFLCVFSLLLVGTALSKLVLYVGSFGLTRLRVLTSVFLVFLAVVLVAAACRLFSNRVPAVPIAVVTGVALLAALCLCNVDGIIARYNVEAYRSGRLSGLDIDTVCSLDNNAVPVLAELLEDPDPKVADTAAKSLAIRAQRFGFSLKTDPAKAGNMDLRSWNTVDSTARRCILAHWDQIRPALAELTAESRKPSSP